jgi:hypothetical protein
MIRVFAGYDRREAQGFHVFLESLIRNAAEPVAITPLQGEQRDGTNAFTYARFLVPYLCDFQGQAIFVDGSDMLMRADIAELAALSDPRYAVQVVQHDYLTKHPRKYLGTEMEAANENYPRKNWSSVVLWNCEHPKHRWMEPAAIKKLPGSFLHRFSWLNNSEIGALPAEWNRLVGETQPTKLAHFTLGLPSIPAYRQLEHADEWHAITDKMHAEEPIHGI